MEYLNDEIHLVATWLKANKLSINSKNKQTNKNKFMNFRPKQKKLLLTRLLRIDHTITEEVEGIKFVGVHIDQHFAWKTHINYICTKI